MHKYSNVHTHTHTHALHITLADTQRAIDKFTYTAHRKTHTHTHTLKDRQSSRQANRQINKLNHEETKKHACRHTDNWKDRRAHRQKYIKTYRWVVEKRRDPDTQRDTATQSWRDSNSETEKRYTESPSNRDTLVSLKEP